MQAYSKKIFFYFCKFTTSNGPQCSVVNWWLSQKWSPEIKCRAYDKAMPGMGYRTSRGEATDVYRTMVESWLEREHRRNSEEELPPLPLPLPQISYEGTRDWTSTLNIDRELKEEIMSLIWLLSSPSIKRFLVTVVESSWKSGEWSVAHEQLRVAIGHRTGNGFTFPGVQGGHDTGSKAPWFARLISSNKPN
jgi:hypothetical protein